MKLYTVWVGGVEVVDHLVDRQAANNIATSYIEDGYDDVAVEEYDLKLKEA